MSYMDIPVNYEYIPVEQYGEQYKVSRKEADKLFALEECINEDPFFRYGDTEVIREILKDPVKVQELAERYSSVHTWDQMQDLVEKYYGAGGFKKKPLGKKLKFSEQDYVYAKNKRARKEVQDGIQERKVEAAERKMLAVRRLGEALQGQAEEMEVLLEKLSDIKDYISGNLKSPRGNDSKKTWSPKVFWEEGLLEDLSGYNSKFSEQVASFKNTVLEIFYLEDIANWKTYMRSYSNLKGKNGFGTKDGTAWAQYQALKGAGFSIEKVQDFQEILGHGWENGNKFGVDMPKLVDELTAIYGLLCGITQILEKKIARFWAPMRDTVKSNLYYSAFPACIKRIEKLLSQYGVEFSPYVPYESESDND